MQAIHARSNRTLAWRRALGGGNSIVGAPWAYDERAVVNWEIG
jgi:hypothetical protein